jgi:hypothetical protein
MISNSAFFTKVKNKKKNKQSTPDGHRDRRSGQGGNSDDEPDDLDPVVLRSRQLASKLQTKPYMYSHNFLKPNKVSNNSSFNFLMGFPRK